MTGPRHEWAVLKAHNEVELAEQLSRLDEQGYTIRDIFAHAAASKHEPASFTVVGVRERPIPMPPAPDEVVAEAKAR